MANASQYNGNVIDKMTVVMVQMRLSVLELVEVWKKYFLLTNEKFKIFGIKINYVLLIIVIEAISCLIRFWHSEALY